MLELIQYHPLAEILNSASSVVKMGFEDERLSMVSFLSFRGGVWVGGINRVVYINVHFLHLLLNYKCINIMWHSLCFHLS